MWILAFSFIVEFLQYFHLIEKLGWEKSKIARSVIGTSFARIDLIAYAVGIAVIVVVEKWLLKKILLLNADVERNKNG
ncbi:MAG: DUF2809 domain-containing protein [Chitinophagales bacterium]